MLADELTDTEWDVVAQAVENRRRREAAATMEAPTR